MSDYRAHIVIRQLFYLSHFVGSAEAVEKVQQRDARVECGRLRDQGEVHDFLDAGGREQTPAGLPDGHDVAVIAENRKRLRGERARRDMKDRGRELASDL